MENKPNSVFICILVQHVIIFSIHGLLLYKLSMKSGNLLGQTSVCVG
jgi:hypothetical protein